MHDIIPDIHGQYDKLVAALTGLGYRHIAGAWRHSNPARTCAFLGDFIDRGPRNADVIHVVRHMLDAGTAIALMGNADKDGNERTEVRVKWWNSNGENWADVTMSVPDPSALPTSPLPKNITALAYPETSKPVLFGHYWMTGTPRMQSPNALCLDYSAGKDGPLMAYTMETGAPFSLDRLQRFGA